VAVRHISGDDILSMTFSSDRRCVCWMDYYDLIRALRGLPRLSS
jgi:hypothetical protein